MASIDKDFKVKNGLIVGDSTNLVNYTSSSPSNPFLGQLWISASSLYAWSSASTWVLVGDGGGGGSASGTPLNIPNTLVSRSASGIFSIGAIDLDLSGTVPLGVGRFQWNSSFGTPEVGLTGGNVTAHIGQHVHAYVTNAQGSPLVKGDVVYLFGASGDRASVKKAINTSDPTSAKTLGVVAEAITTGGQGYVTVFGVVDKLNLSAYSPGDTLWLSASAGKFTSVKPSSPNHTVFIGVVERANAGNGQLFVNVQNGYELDELHNVSIINAADNDIISYNQSASLWLNQNLATAITEVDGAGSGIDADLLDGEHGSYYLDWNNATNKPDLIITLGGDLSGSVTFTDLASGTLNATIASDSVALGADTTGNYVASVSGTDGVSISGTGEGATVTISNSDKGSSQNIFKNVAVSGQSTIVADANDDTLTIASGSGITLITNATTDTLTINNSGVTSVNGSAGAITGLATTAQALQWDGGSTNLVAATGRTSLGATTVGSNVFTLTNPSAVSYIKIAADNTVSAASASTIKTDLSLNNVENTALSTWAGSTNITTLGTISSGAWSGTAIGVTKGGTGLTAGPTVNGQLLIGSSAGSYTLAAITQGSGITVTNGAGSISIANSGVTGILGTTNQIIASASTGNVTLSLPNAVTFPGTVTLNADPTQALQAVTKQYVDAIAEGLHVHQSCAAATTASITNLSTPPATIDGVTLTTDMRVLVKNQTTTSQNGIYVFNGTALVRATDFDSPAEIDGGDFVFITGGTSNDSTGWVQTETVATVGTSPIIFNQFSGPGTYTAGNGLTLTGSQFSINTGVTADLSTAQTLTNKTINGANNTLTVRLANDITGFGTEVATFLATPTSANLAAAVTDETGSGALVFATSPTLVTPNIGVATGTSLSTSGAITASATSGRVSLGVDAGGSISLGRIDNTSNTPYIDFNSGATTVDFDVRVQASGGDGTAGNGTLTITGTLATEASSTGHVGFRLPHGTEPTASTNGDIWTTTSGLFARINGATQQYAPTSGTLAQFAATTSAQLAGVISDETGTGSLVFGTSPTLVSPAFTGSATFQNATFSGILESTELREVVVDVTLSSNVGTLDWTAGNVYYIATSPTGAMTFNITNVPTNISKMMNVTVFVTQGATGYLPTTFQIDGAAQTIRWAGGTAPTPTSGVGKIDVFSFTIQRTSGGAWIVYGTSTLGF